MFPSGVVSDAIACASRSAGASVIALSELWTSASFGPPCAPPFASISK